MAACLAAIIGYESQDAERSTLPATAAQTRSKRAPREVASRSPVHEFLAYFIALESDAARSGPYEGTDSIIQMCDVGELVFDTGMPGINLLRFDGPPDGLVNIRISLNET